MDKITSQEQFTVDYNAFGIMSGITPYNNQLNSLNGAIPDTSSSVVSPQSLTSGQTSSQVSVVNGFFQSSNFVTGSAGWQINSNGNVEFGSGYFRGDITGASGTFSGAITATSGTIGGFTIGATTLTGGAGGDIKTASSGERIEILSSTKRLNAINSNGDVVAILSYSAVGSNSVLLLSPKYTARRALEIILPASFTSGSEGDAKAITIDNAADSICIDITDGGLVGLQIAACDTSAINVTNAPTNGPGLDLTYSGGDYPVIDLEQSGTAANSYGIRLTQGSAAVKSGLYINNTANTHLARAIHINRAGNIDSQVVAAIRIDCLNTGVGGLATGIDFTGATIQSIMNVAADATAAGTYAGRIPIYVAGVLKYIHYYNA